jgi:hypothetical protein
VTDWENEVWVCDFGKGSFTRSAQAVEFDIRIASQPLGYAFQTPFGIQTLGVSGRYQFSRNYRDVPRSWKRIRVISSLFNAGITLSVAGLFSSSMRRWVWQRRVGLISQIAQQVGRFSV